MFDAETGRCMYSECDGHYTHHAGCPLFETPSVLTVEQRVSLYSGLIG